MKKLSFAIAKNTGVPYEEVQSFLRQGLQSHCARMGHAYPGRKAEVRADYQAWLARVRATGRLWYYRAYPGQVWEPVYFA